jgi:hypothetical protein
LAGRTACALALLLAAPALAHPKGFHKKVVLTVTREGVDALVALDIDGGPRTQLLRAAADADKDGVLSHDEALALKKELVAILLRPLAISVSGYKLRFEDVDAKVDLRRDRRVADGGLSVAVLRRARFPGPATGMQLVLTDESPDQSPVSVEIHQALPDAGDQVTAMDLPRGASQSVRLW